MKISHKISGYSKRFKREILELLPIPPIHKIDYVNIVSIGRTGTKFLANYFNEYFPTQVISNHEVIKSNKYLHARYHLGKVDTKYSEKLWRNDRLYYFKIVHYTNKKIWIESDPFNRTLIPIVKNVMNNYKFIFIVRDPRTWIRSFLSRPNYRYHQDENWYITPVLTGELNQDEWNSYSLIQKASWAWKYNNALIFDELKNDRNAIIIKFEDIFSSKSNIKTLFDFIELKYSSKIFSHIKKKTNYTETYLVPNFESWDLADQEFMYNICKQLMKEFGYIN